MLKLLNRRTFSLFKNSRFYLSTKDSKDFLVKKNEMISFEDSPKVNSFIPNVYGLELKRHFFPGEKENIKLS